MHIPTKKLAAGMILVATGAAVGAGVGAYFRSPPEPSPTVQLNNPKSLPLPFQPVGSQAMPAENLNFIALAAQKVGPAVVRIDASFTAGKEAEDDD